MSGTSNETELQIAKRKAEERLTELYKERQKEIEDAIGEELARVVKYKDDGGVDVLLTINSNPGGAQAIERLREEEINIRNQWTPAPKAKYERSDYCESVLRIHPSIKDWEKAGRRLIWKIGVTDGKEIYIKKVFLNKNDVELCIHIGDYVLPHARFGIEHDVMTGDMCNKFTRWVGDIFRERIYNVIEEVRNEGVENVFFESVRKAQGEERNPKSFD